MKLTTEQFDSITWHDNVLHAISFVDEDFKNDLILDIDYIIEWLNQDCGCSYEFRVAPAHLVFHEVSNLKINFSKGPQLMMFSYLADINAISREPMGENRYRWEIHLLGGEGNLISFEASGFTQQTYKEPIVTTLQHLTSEQRKMA